MAKNGTNEKCTEIYGTFQTSVNNNERCIDKQAHTPGKEKPLLLYLSTFMRGMICKKFTGRRCTNTRGRKGLCQLPTGVWENHTGGIGARRL